MTSDRLAVAYLEKARIRLKALETLHNEGGYSDVVREAQECVELVLKALLRACGIEAPKTHDVSRILNENKTVLPVSVQGHLDEIMLISKTLRKDRELAFYGTEDWIPTDEYSADDSQKAFDQARRVYEWVSVAIRS